MLNVARVVNNPRFTQALTVYRKGGAYGAGGWIPSESIVAIQGIVTVPSENDLNQIPEGDRNNGSITVHSTQLILQTGVQGTSDEVLWQGELYRVMNVWPLNQYGYYKAVAVRMVAT